MTNETNPGTVGSKDLSDALAWARNWMANASPEEKAMMWQAQRESWSNGPHGPTDGMGTVYVAAQSQPAATVQEVGREDNGGPCYCWCHPNAGTIGCSPCCDAEDNYLPPSKRDAALTTEPAAKAVSAISANWDQQPSPQPDMGSGIDGNDIWEALFGILKGDVPDALTEEVCEQLAATLSTLPHKEEATPALQDERMVLLPRVMTAAMINAWSGGLTVSSDENAGRITFQDAWQRVIEAATPATTTTERGRG